MNEVKILESNNRINLSSQLSKALNNGWVINGQLIITPYRDNNESEVPLFWYSILVTKKIIK